MSDDPIQPDSAPFGDDPLSDSPFSSPEDQLQDGDSWLLEGADGEAGEGAAVHAEVQALPDEFIVEVDEGDELQGAAPISEEDLVGASYVEPEPGSRVLSRALVPAAVALVLSFGGVAAWKFMESGGVALRPEVAETPDADSVVRVPERKKDVGLPPVIESIEGGERTGRMRYMHDGSVVPVAVEEPGPEPTVETPREPGELSTAPMEFMADVDTGTDFGATGSMIAEMEPDLAPSGEDTGASVADAFDAALEPIAEPSTSDTGFAVADAPVDSEPEIPLTITDHPFFATLASVGLPVDPFAEGPVDIHGRADFGAEPCVPFAEFDVAGSGAPVDPTEDEAPAPFLDRARLVDEIAAAPIASEEELEAMAFVPFTFGAEEMTSEVAVQTEEPPAVPEPASEPAPEKEPKIADSAAEQADSPAEVVAEDTPETVAEAPVPTVEETVEPTVADAPAETTDEPVAEMAAEVPVEIAAEPMADEPQETVAETVAEVPAVTSEEPVVETPEEAVVAEAPAPAPTEEEVSSDVIAQETTPETPEASEAPVFAEGTDIDVEAVHARLDAIFGINDDLVFEPIEVAEVEPIPVEVPEETPAEVAVEIPEQARPAISEIFPAPAPVDVAAEDAPEEPQVIDPAAELFEPEGETEAVATVELPAPAEEPGPSMPEEPATVTPEPTELPSVAVEPSAPLEPAAVEEAPAAEVAIADEPSTETPSAEPTAPAVAVAEPEAPDEVRPSIAKDAPGRSRGSVLFRPDTDNVWAHRTVPKSKLGGDTFVLTPKVGTVRVLFDGEETMEGRLHGVGAGRVVIDSRLGRLTLGADRVDTITRISTRRGARRTLSSTPSLAGLERVRVRVAGGTFDGHLVAREGNRVTLMLDEGKRITVTATEVIPAGRQRATSRIRRSPAQGAAPRR